jgi:hypothetical protein
MGDFEMNPLNGSGAHYDEVSIFVVYLVFVKSPILFEFKIN